MKNVETKKLEEARDHWKQLADDERKMAQFYEESNLYGDTKSFYNRAETYERTAQALQIQIDTGVAVCSCCFKPFGTGTIDYI